MLITLIILTLISLITGKNLVGRKRHAKENNGES
jgi:hypothetical protein